MEDMQDMEQRIRKARNEYMREWRRKNPEKVRAISRRYWATRANKKAALTKQ